MSVSQVTLLTEEAFGFFFFDRLSKMTPSEIQTLRQILLDAQIIKDPDKIQVALDTLGIT